MGVFNAAGNTRYTAATLPVTPKDALDPEFTVDADIYETVSVGRADRTVTTGGTVRRLIAKAGGTIKQSRINSLFPAPRIDSVSPLAAAAAGGTTITVRGANLDGVTAATLGGTACTSVTVVNTETVTLVTPAKTAGTYALALTDDSGAVALGNVVVS